MKFIVAEDVFGKMENVCFGVVVAKGLNNEGVHSEIARLLEESIKSVQDKFAFQKVKESTEIIPYREAFTKLGINPNKYMSSIEAMASRIEKKKGMPNINPVVDLGNAISLKYLVPMGAHDMDSANEDISVRLSKPGDRFVPFGTTEEETLDLGEVIYSVGAAVKTRRWIWRQSELGKVTEETKNVFFPIDGFRDQNYHQVMDARDELAGVVQQLFGCEVQVGLVDKDHREMAL